MPCYAWGIPAQACGVGAKLVGFEGSTCRSCYALRGFYRQTKVQAAYSRRLERFDAPLWVTAMAKLVYWQVAETGEPYFRWFDSGDLQSVDMLCRIAEVAAATPEVQHWLPTREYAIVASYLRQWAFPPNLTVRVSAPMVNGPTPRQFGLSTSTVHSSSGNVVGLACSAYTSKPASCADCRACWDPKVENVSYPLH